MENRNNNSRMRNHQVWYLVWAILLTFTALITVPKILNNPLPAHENSVIHQVNQPEHVPVYADSTPQKEMDSLLFGQLEVFEGGDPPDTIFNYDDFSIDDAFSSPEPIEGEPDPEPVEYMVVDTPNLPLNMDEMWKLIGYPPMAMEAEIEGKVVLKVLIDPEGNYLKHLVLRDPHPILTRAVEKHIDKLKMSPVRKSGETVTAWVVVPFSFLLQR